MKNIGIFVILFFLLVGCGISKDEHQKVIDENEQLKIEISKLNDEIEQYRYGEERTIALIEQAYSNNDIELARKHIDTFLNYHPQSIGNNSFIKILSLVEQEEKNIREVAERAEQERIRQERLANIGKTADNPIVINGRSNFPWNILRDIALDLEKYNNKYVNIENIIYEYFGSYPAYSMSGMSDWFDRNDTWLFTHKRGAVFDEGFRFYFQPTERNGRSEMLELSRKYYNESQLLTIKGKIIGIKERNSSKVNYVYIVTELIRRGEKYLGSLPPEANWNIS